MTTRSAWKIYLALLFGTFVTVEASAFGVPALPTIARHFEISVSLASLMTLLYYLGLTTFCPIMGRLADRIGCRRMTLIGLGVFSAAEFLAALSPNYTVLLIARLLQGLGVACILPCILAYIRVLFPDNKRGTALGIFAFTMSLGGATGAFLGGLLIDTWGWQSIFWVSGVFGLIGLFIVMVVVPETEKKDDGGSFDLAGAALLFVAIGSLLSMPVWANNTGMGSPYTLTAMVLAVTSIFLLWRVELQASSPVVDLSILKQRTFAMPAAIYMFYMVAFIAFVYSLVFFINDRPGGSASQVGLINMFIFGAGMLFAPIGGRLCDKIEPRILIQAGLGITVCGLFLYRTLDAETSLYFVAGTGILMGMMTGAIVPAVMKLALGSVPKERLGAGTGLFVMLRDLGPPAGSAFGLALFGLLMALAQQTSFEHRATGMGLEESVYGGLYASHGSATVTPEVAEQLNEAGVILDELVQLANRDAISMTMTSMGNILIGLVSLLFALSFLLPRKRREETDETAGITQPQPSD